MLALQIYISHYLVTYYWTNMYFSNQVMKLYPTLDLKSLLYAYIEIKTVLQELRLDTARYTDSSTGISDDKDIIPLKKKISK